MVPSGAPAARRRSAFSTSISIDDRRSTRRASTTLSRRPRPTAPAKRPTSRSQVTRSGRSPRSASGASAGRATTAPVPGLSVAARATSASQRRSAARGSGASPSSASLAPGTVCAIVTKVAPCARAKVSAGRTSDAAPNAPHASSAAGGAPVKPRPPRRIGPTPRGEPAGTSIAAPSRRERQAAAARANRSGPWGSTDQARPIPTSANPADGWSHSAASRSSSRAAAKRLIGSIAGPGRAQTRSERASTDGSPAFGCVRSPRTPVADPAGALAPGASTTVTLPGPGWRSGPPGRLRCAGGAPEGAGTSPRAAPARRP